MSGYLRRVNYVAGGVSQREGCVRIRVEEGLVCYGTGSLFSNWVRVCGGVGVRVRTLRLRLGQG